MIAEVDVHVHGIVADNEILTVKVLIQLTCILPAGLIDQHPIEVDVDLAGLATRHSDRSFSCEYKLILGNSVALIIHLKTGVGLFAGHILTELLEAVKLMWLIAVFVAAHLALIELELVHGN